MVIRSATIEDLCAVEELYAQVVAHMRVNPPDVWWEMGVHPSREELEHAARAGELLAAFEGERALGAVIVNDMAGDDYALAPWVVPARPQEVRVLHLLCVGPKARGRGVARALIREAADRSRAAGALALRLDTFDIDAPAIALYRSCGFRDYGIFDITVGGGLTHPSHLMELDLREGPVLTPAQLTSCELCPRACHADRAAGERGVCGATGSLKLARAALHYWEEPPISGEAGSGTIFFSGCPLKCVYCQNHEISTGNFGLEVPDERLVEIMLELADQGALNINLVTATHMAHLLPAAITEARARRMLLPIVYNTSGYERVEAVRELAASAVPDGRPLVDIWLTDFKYADPALGRALSHVPDYPEVARAALAEMAHAVAARGGTMCDDEGIMQQGIIVRHLVLPGHADDSCRVLDLIWETAGDVPISVMNQYTPNAAMRAAGGELARAVTNDEYELVLDHADNLGFTQLFWQEGGAVDESFTPPFDTTGVLAPATKR